jgi:hypothetical protein
VTLGQRATADQARHVCQSLGFGGTEATTAHICHRGRGDRPGRRKHPGLESIMLDGFAKRLYQPIQQRGSRLQAQLLERHHAGNSLEQIWKPRGPHPTQVLGNRLKAWLSVESRTEFSKLDIQGKHSTQDRDNCCVDRLRKVSCGDGDLSRARFDRPALSNGYQAVPLWRSDAADVSVGLPAIYQVVGGATQELDGDCQGVRPWQVKYPTTFLHHMVIRVRDRKYQDRARRPAHDVFGTPDQYDHH